MKKWVFVSFVLVVLLLAGIHFFIPQKLRISSIAVIRANPNSTFRYLSDERKWKKWWPAEEHKGKKAWKDDGKFYSGGFSFKLQGQMWNRISVAIQRNKANTNSFIHIIPVGPDSAVLEWSGTYAPGNNLIEKAKGYLLAQRMKQNMQVLLKSLESFLEKQENIYGFSIREVKVKDTLLIAIRSRSAAFPSTPFVYALIDSLKRYAAGRDAVPTNHPMLHITPQEINGNGNGYEAYVALPVSKELKGNKTFLFKRMVPGNILVTEVKGGYGTIQKAFTELENYKSDYQRTSPAIPFESLVTDRSREKDTAKWITRIYYPVY